MSLDQSRSGTSDTNKLPNTVAFNDEFTRDFMKSSKEEEEGHYLFESITEGYTILFPINAEVDKGVYERHHDVFESVSFLEEDKEDNLSLYYSISYDDQPRANDIDFNLHLFKSYVNYEGQFEEYSLENKSFYYAENVFEYKGKKSFRYFAYIKPDIQDKGASFIADITCLEMEKSCAADSEEVKQRITKIMHSINFRSR